MNFQQLEYIIAVDRYKNFVKASEACFVTQATLSMMIKKLEDELEVKLFDRSKQPVKTTEIGVKIIFQAKKILFETSKIKSLINEEKELVNGELRIGIIPTLAPYLLPLFIKKFVSNFPHIKLIINEFTTDEILSKLKAGNLDAAVLATPIRDNSLNEEVLFYEKYFLYVNDHEKGFDKNYVLPKDIDVNRLWLLEAGHCMRSQIINFCELKKLNELEEQFHYNAGSIETLRNMVDTNFGMTIIPELATLHFSSQQRKRLRSFKKPFPVREISLVTHREFLKETLLKHFYNTIFQCIPNELKKNEKVNVLQI